MKSSSTLLSKINRIFWGVAIALLIGELTAKLYIEHFADEGRLLKFGSATQLRSKGYVASAMAHNYIGYVATPNYHKGRINHNSLGFKGDEFKKEKSENEFRIVCIGGSTTYNISVADYKQSYPHQLQEILKTKHNQQITVINAGLPGYTSWESLINYELRIQELQPDLIIVYHGVNDVKARMVWPPEAYKADNSGYRIRKFPENSTYDLISYFSLGRIVLASFSDFKINNLETSLNGISPNSLAIEMAQQMNHGNYPSGVFDTLSVEKVLKHNPPIYFENNLRRMIALTKADGTDVILCSFKVIPFIKNGQNMNAPYQEGLKDENPMIKRVANETAVHFVDMDSLFPSDQQLFTDGIHKNEKGCLEFAQILADYISSNQIIKP